MAAAVRDWTCPHCGYSLRARGSQVWHPCPKQRTKAGKARMVELEPEEGQKK